MVDETITVAEAISKIKEIDWRALGASHARGFVRTVDDAYTIETDSTPWRDVRPDEFRRIAQQLGDELSESDQAAWEEAEEEASEAYNEGWYNEQARVLEELDQQRVEELEEAGSEGWRICVFGLPGSQAHTWRIAAPGEADKVLAEIYQPGPLGPYESEILTPLEASQRTHLDGTHVYGRTWRDIQYHAPFDID